MRKPTISTLTDTLFPYTTLSRSLTVFLFPVLDGVEDLVGLLQQGAREARVCLLAIPGALGPQRADQLVEASHLAGHGLAQLRDPQRREVVGLERAVEVVPCDLPHRLIGQAQALEHGDRRPVLHRELDVGEHVGPIALADEQRAALAGGLDRESDRKSTR